MEEITVLIDENSMYSDVREFRIVFLQIVSKERKDNGELRSVFAQGFTWKRLAVPQPVKILHRCKFEDWSLKVSSVSRGNLDTTM